MAQERLVGHREGGQFDCIRARALCQFRTASTRERARAFLLDKEQRAAEMVARCWPEIEAVALTLLDCPELDEEEFRYLLARLDEDRADREQEDRADRQRWLEELASDEADAGCTLI
jgi:hypothetical protein